MANPPVHHRNKAGKIVLAVVVCECRYCQKLMAGRKIRFILLIMLFAACVIEQDLMCCEINSKLVQFDIVFVGASC